MNRCCSSCLKRSYGALNVPNWQQLGSLVEQLYTAGMCWKGHPEESLHLAVHSGSSPARKYYTPWKSTNHYLSPQQDTESIQSISTDLQRNREKYTIKICFENLFIKKTGNIWSNSFFYFLSFLFSYLNVYMFFVYSGFLYRIKYLILLNKV